MSGPVSRLKFAIERIVHHYFFQPGSIMVRFPRLYFSKRYPQNRGRLAAVLRAERAAGRMSAWHIGTPEPFPAHRILLFRGFH